MKVENNDHFLVAVESDSTLLESSQLPIEVRSNAGNKVSWGKHSDEELLRLFLGSRSKSTFGYSIIEMQRLSAIQMLFVAFKIDEKFSVSHAHLIIDILSKRGFSPSQMLSIVKKETSRLSQKAVHSVSINQLLQQTIAQSVDWNAIGSAKAMSLLIASGFNEYLIQSAIENNMLSSTDMVILGHTK